MPDSSRFFTTDATYGALLDRNGDGVPDDLRVRFGVVGEPDVEEWCELIHLAARLGLEVGALTLPLGLAAGMTPPPASRTLTYVAANSAPDKTDPNDWTVSGADVLRGLWQTGLGDSTSEEASRQGESFTALDLTQFYDLPGLLRDDDGDLLPDRIALTIVLSRPPTSAIGLALCDLAARLGMESTGVRFPLAVPFGTPIPSDSVPLSIAGPIPGLARPGPGEAICAVSPDEQGRTAILVAGDETNAARLIRDLAATWPYPRTWDAAGTTVADLLGNLSATLHAEDTTGRAALLAADLLALGGQSARGELRLLDADPALRAAAERTIARQNLPLTMVEATADRVAFADEWTAEWEVDRARRLVAERVLPGLDPSQPANLLVLVSEPREVRTALATEWSAALPQGSRVRVLSAFKAGLSWLREEVIPAWSARGDVARVELRYRPFVAPEGTRHLDLPIRWLQELYPGDALLATALGLTPEAIALVEDRDQGETYTAVAYDARGAILDTQGFSPRAYTRPYLANAPDDGLVLVTTGAVIAQQGDRTLCDESLPTDLDQFWDHYQHDILPRVFALIADETGGTLAPDAQPFFASLDVEVWCSEPNEALDVREELYSSAEALHEDIYFGTLDAIAVLGTAAPASGTLAPAQAGALDAPGPIRPFVHVTPGRPPRSTITLRRRLRHLAEIVPENPIADRRILGVLPTGPRPQLAVAWLTSHAATPGFARLGISVAAEDDRTVALLRQLAEISPPAENTVTAEFVVNGATIAIGLAWDAARSASSPQAEIAPLPAAPITPEQLPGLLESLTANATVRRVGRSFEGRAIDAIEVVKPGGGAIWSRRKASLHKTTLLVIARHHANEPASTHAALHLAQLCATDREYASLLDRVNIAILPLANPDGAALHALMAAEHPRWKHHAARYNAVGREFARDHYDPDTPWGEARVRPRLWREWLPDVVVDNHGVPSHEWDQLFDGFGSPPRFGVSYWLVSALIYGIMRYPTEHPAHATIAAALRDRIAAAVGADARLAAGNRAHRADYERWGHDLVPERFPATYHRDMLWYFGPQTPEGRARLPQPEVYDRVTAATLVTEVPDETAQGDYLHLVAHAHLVANRAILDLLAERAPRVQRRVTADSVGMRVTLWRPRPLD